MAQGKDLIAELFGELPAQGEGQEQGTADVGELDGGGKVSMTAPDQSGESGTDAQSGLAALQRILQSQGANVPGAAQTETEGVAQTDAGSPALPTVASTPRSVAGVLIEPGKGLSEDRIALLAHKVEWMESQRREHQARADREQEARKKLEREVAALKAQANGDVELGAEPPEGVAASAESAGVQEIKAQIAELQRQLSKPTEAQRMQQDLAMAENLMAATGADNTAFQVVNAGKVETTDVKTRTAQWLNSLEAQLRQSGTYEQYVPNEGARWSLLNVAYGKALQELAGWMARSAAQELEVRKAPVRHVGPRVGGLAPAQAGGGQGMRQAGWINQDDVASRAVGL